MLIHIARQNSGSYFPISERTGEGGIYHILEVIGPIVISDSI